MLGFNGLSWAAVLLFCAPCALTSGVLSGFSTSLAWWAEHLPEHRLGVFGILLMLFSFVLPIVQPLVDILNIPVH